MSGEYAPDRSAVLDALRRPGRMLIVTHVRADGDALGSALALQASAALAGKEAGMVLAEEPPRRYQFLFASRRPVLLTQDASRRFAEIADQADRVVVVDTCSFEQLGPLAEPLRPRRSKVVVIDHHASADDVGAIVWRDTSAAAAGVMVSELLCELGWPADPGILEALGTAIYTDTGWLHYANTDARAMKAVGWLIASGLRPDALYARTYQNDRPERLKLLAAALASLTLHHDRRLAVMSLTRPDFARTGAAEAETEDLVNEGLRIASVEVAALLTEQPDGKVRASLRSRKVEVSNPDTSGLEPLVDVAAVAQTFGGGGHVRASGFRSAEPLEVVKQHLIAACAGLLADRS